MVGRKKLVDQRNITALFVAGLLLILISFKSFAEQNISLVHDLDMTIGNPESRVTVVDYSSLTCPHCATFHAEIFPKLKEEYIDTGKVNLIFREVYFDGPGLWASMVARCRDKGAFFPTIDLLFRKQDVWSSSSSQIDIVNGLTSIGKQVGLSDKEVLDCLKDRDKAKDLVGWYKNNSARDSIDSTPTIIVNGETLSNRSYPSLKEAIEVHLKD
ncbi:MAG: thiol-disulfide oxidoreductase [Rhodobacteraceae bacterium]|nr:MAG: thiol-disulfide oxidoreductase [Paracoccaceae bacterium]